jgi:hypothetical protein
VWCHHAWVWFLLAVWDFCSQSVISTSTKVIPTHMTVILMHDTQSTIFYMRYVILTPMIVFKILTSVNKTRISVILTWTGVVETFLTVTMQIATFQIATFLFSLPAILFVQNMSEFNFLICFVREYMCVVVLWVQMKSHKKNRK